MASDQRLPSAMHAPYPLNPAIPDEEFPDPALALVEPNGLLAFGGDLSVARLAKAYRSGIFPWYSAGQPLLWWSPDPRTVLFPQAMHISRSLRKTLRSGRYTCSFDRDFATVVRACAAPRASAGNSHSGTWITAEMHAAYRRLHVAGHAHSVEVWHGEELVGGLYGVAVGGCFCGESMFSRRRDTSKVALAWLARQLHTWGYGMIDCQLPTAHLASLGAIDIPREEYLAWLDRLRDIPGQTVWRFDPDLTW